MLSAGERPQPPVTPAVIPTTTRVMPIEPNAGASAMPSALPARSSTDSKSTQHIWVVTGPAGCGKSTVGQALRKDLGVAFLEGDDVRKPTSSPSVIIRRREEKKSQKESQTNKY